jgi:hypothetical protein
MVVPLCRTGYLATVFGSIVRWKNLDQLGNGFVKSWLVDKDAVLQKV